jgi:hypothetical protein
MIRFGSMPSIGRRKRSWRETESGSELPHSKARRAEKKGLLVCGLWFLVSGFWMLPSASRSRKRTAHGARLKAAASRPHSKARRAEKKGFLVSSF